MKRIGIVLFEYILGYSPLVINSALLLEAEGYEVHVFIDARTYRRGKISFENKNIVIHAIDIGDPRSMHALNALERLFSAEGTFGKLQATPIKGVYAQANTIFSKLLYFHNKLRYSRDAREDVLAQRTATFFPGIFEFYQKVAQHIDDAFICVLGVDTKGIIAATLIANNLERPTRLPVIYYNMELLLKRHANTLQLMALKSLERTCTELCYFVVIQDKTRAMYFAEDNRVPREKLVCVPVSGLREPYRLKSSYFRQLFEISPEKRILIHAGHLMEVNMCLELAEAASAWAEDLVLILHSPTPNLSRSYLNQIKRVGARNVYISVNPVGWEQLPEVMSSGDIGLIFYKDLDPNFLETGRSSNKLVQYLQVGLPVISVDFPSLKAVLDECRCGKTASHPREIEALARQILSDYSSYRDRSFECYTRRYNIADYFDNILERIQQIK